MLVAAAEEKDGGDAVQEFLDAADQIGRTALHRATRSGSEEAIKVGGQAGREAGGLAGWQRLLLWPATLDLQTPTDATCSSQGSTCVLIITTCSAWPL